MALGRTPRKAVKKPTARIELVRKLQSLRAKRLQQIKNNFAVALEPGNHSDRAHFEKNAHGLISKVGKIEAKIMEIRRKHRK